MFTFPAAVWGCNGNGDFALMAALKRKGCPCTDEEQLNEATLFRERALRGEFELPPAGDVEWLLFSYT